MTPYRPPVEDMQFLLTRVIGLEGIEKAKDLDAETIGSVLEEAAKFSSGVLAPLNAEGDRAGCAFEGGAVRMPPGFREAYAVYRDGGWNAVPFDPDYGGQGLPWVLAFALQEMWQGASLAFGLCPLLNQGAVEAIHTHGSAEQKSFYLPKLVSGHWTGAMNLTEPQAGSDLSAIRTRAEARPDGTYGITGQKIFITYGEHDLSDNIVHLVLARIPGAPEGIKGLSLFIVPKFLKDGSRNGVVCAGIERKLGIHASPTCTMVYENAVGELIGQAGEGLKYMFTMMNNARLSVGLQGVALAERAAQAAMAYAQERVQGSLPSNGERIVIAKHPDVRRLLLSMRAQIEAARAMTYEAAAMLDRAEQGDAAAQAHVDLMTPVVKAWGTDLAVELSSSAIQVYGGMGYIEETGMPQLYRDARILPIYEGTNGIQAMDLAFRKILRDGGRGARKWIEGAREQASGHADILVALSRLDQSVTWVLETGEKGDPEMVAAGAAPLCRAFGQIAGAVMLARCERAAQAGLRTDPMATAFYQGKIAAARFYRDNILPYALSSLDIARKGGASVLS